MNYVFFSMTKNGKYEFSSGIFWFRTTQPGFSLVKRKQTKGVGALPRGVASVWQRRRPPTANECSVISFDKDNWSRQQSFRSVLFFCGKFHTSLLHFVEKRKEELKVSTKKFKSLFKENFLGRRRFVRAMKSHHTRRANPGRFVVKRTSNVTPEWLKKKLVSDGVVVLFRLPSFLGFHLVYSALTSFTQLNLALVLPSFNPSFTQSFSTRLLQLYLVVASFIGYYLVLLERATTLFFQIFGCMAISLVPKLGKTR